MTACIEADVDISMQVNGIFMCAASNRYQIDTLVQLALKKAPEEVLAGAGGAEGGAGLKPAGLTLQTSDPFDTWWEQAEAVMSPVKRAPGRFTGVGTEEEGAAHAHSDSDSDAEHVMEGESTATALYSHGGVASSTKRPHSFRFNEPIEDDFSFFDGRGKAKAPTHEDGQGEHEGVFGVGHKEGEAFEGASSTAAAAGGSGGATVSIAAVREAGVRKSDASHAVTRTRVKEVHKDECEGLLYLRVQGALFSHKWRARYVVLHKGVILVYSSRYDRVKDANNTLETIHLTESMALSGMKVAPPAGDRPRITYRHIAQLDAGGVFDDHQQADANAAGQSRVFKFGTDSTEEFERWSAAFNAAIERVKRRERRAAAEALELSSALSSADAFAEALRSPKARPHRRHSTGWGSGISSLFHRGSEGGGATQLDEESETSLSVSTLDGKKHAILVHQGGTVKDALVSLREKVKLQSDADFSLFIRDRKGGRELFTLLPDIMSAAEADVAASQDSRDLVFKRRMFLPPTEDEKAAKKGSVVPPVELEAAQATDHTQAAHALLYAEAVHAVVSGQYMVTCDGGALLAGLHAVTHAAIGPYDAAKHAPDGQYLAHHIADLASAAILAEWVHVGHEGPGGTTGVKGFLVAAAAAHAGTAGKSLLNVQQQYLRLVEELDEYGCSFFMARLLRRPSPSSDVKPSTTAPDTPDWAVEVTTTMHAADTDLDHLPVLVGINHHGIWTRPAPPVHAAGHNPLTYTGVVESPAAASAGADEPFSVSAALTRMQALAEGRAVPWMLHKVQYITTFGAHARRPVFVYRVRERTVVSVELVSPQFKEMSSTLHAIIFALLARKQGRAVPHARTDTMDYGAGAIAAKAAMKAARQQAGFDEQVDGHHLPPGWSEIRDPVTGATAYWNSATKTTVWAKPQA